jgi:chaperonin GroES
VSVRPRVLGPRVLLQPLEANESTQGGIVLPDEVRERETRGMVVAVGDPPAGELEAPVHAGDVVIYAAEGATPYARPSRVTVDNDETGHAEQFVIADYGDLLLVLEETGVPA